MKGLALVVGAGGIGTQLANDLNEREKITIEIDRFKAINESIKFADKKDIILIAGKGHEDYQILNDKVINFDDRKIAYKLLKEKNKSQ